MSTPEKGAATGEKRTDRDIRTHVCMFVNNPGLHDPRVTREAEVAVQAGHRVTVIANQDLPGENPVTRTTQRGVLFVRSTPSPSKLVSCVRRVAGVFKAGGRVAPRAKAANAGEDVAGAPPAEERPPRMRRLGNLLWQWRRALLRTIQKVRQGLATNADVYHAHDLDTLAVAWVCARLRGTPLIYDSHELWLDWRKMTGASRAKLAAWGALEAAFCRQARLIVTVSEGIAGILRQRYGLRRLLVVKNCPVASVELSDRVSRAEARAACGIDHDVNVVIYQGGIWPNRGLDILVEAAAAVPNCLFYVVGPENAYAIHLQDLARETGNSNVRFLGHKEKQERDLFMKAADIGVVLTQSRSLSYRYTISNKIFEYFSNGLPVLASNLPPHRDLAARTGACVLTDPEDADDVSSVIRSFFALAPDMRSRMGASGRESIIAEFNMEQQMSPLLDLYSQYAPIRKGPSQ